jgi:transposase
MIQASYAIVPDFFNGLLVVDRNSRSIEVEIEGVTVRIGYGADAKTIAAVLRALKASA